MDTMRGELKGRLKEWQKGGRLRLAEVSPALLRTNARLIPSHSPFPTAKPLVDSPAVGFGEGTVLVL